MGKRRVDSGFGRRLRVIRQVMKLTQAQVAKQTGVPQTTVSDLERGCEPTWSTAVAVAKGLGMPLDSFLEDEDV